MKKRFTIGVAVCCVTMFFTAHAKPTRPQYSEDPILSQKIKLHLSNVTLLNALSRLAVVHRVPIGIEYSQADTNEPKLDLETGDASLKEILDSIIKQEPLYRWELIDGVINFMPVGDGDPFFATLLSTPVAQFDPGKWTIKFQLRDALANTPEVKTLLRSKNIELAKYRDYASRPSIYTEADVDLRKSNTTVRGLLNHIVKVSEHKSWAIGWRRGEQNVFSIWL
jgi:ribosomal protein L24